MDKITVLISTYNGEKYLEEQLNSVLGQEDVKVNIMVRDDGSKDRTTQILAKYQDEGKLKWYSGDNLGPSKSFMDLVYNVEEDADYYAFCDQDDVWLSDKLHIAVEKLKEFPSYEPALYYSATKLVNEDLIPLQDGNPKAGYVSKTMKQTIISSGCTGCTMCFNRKLLDILRLGRYQFDLMHDNWTHKVCVAVGGNLFFDDESHILYRQHGHNVIGGKSNVFSRIKRHFNTAFHNRCYRSESIVALYNAYKDYMSEENRKACEQIVNYHHGLERFRIAADKEFRLGNKRLDCIFIGAILLGVF